MVAELTVSTSRSGLPTLKVNGMPYYSPYDPLRKLADFSNAGSLTGGCQTGEGRKSNGICRPFPGALILRWVVTALRKALKATIPADDK